jgi:hypothetical protein
MKLGGARFLAMTLLLAAAAGAFAWCTPPSGSSYDQAGSSDDPSSGGASNQVVYVPVPVPVLMPDGYTEGDGGAAPSAENPATTATP